MPEAERAESFQVPDQADAARNYIVNQGWAVVPFYGVPQPFVCACGEKRACKQVGNHPHGGHASGCYPPITDAKTNAFGADTNVGVSLKESRLLVVREKFNVRSWFDGKTIPPCPRFLTSDARIYFFRAPDGITGTAKRPGCSILAEGMLLLPPSLGHHQRPYDWHVSPDDVPPPPAPTWLVQALGQTSGSAAPAQGIFLSKLARSGNTSVRFSAATPLSTESTATEGDLGGVGIVEGVGLPSSDPNIESVEPLGSSLTATECDTTYPRVDGRESDTLGSARDMTSAAFLRWWFEGCVGDIRLVALGGDRSVEHVSFSAPHEFAAMEMWAHKQSAERRNVYFKVLTHKPGSPGLGTKESAFEMPGAFAEIDMYKDVSPEEAVAHLEAIGAGKGVSLVVDSGGAGFHVYAKFSAPVTATSTLEDTNYAFGKWLLVRGRPERFDLASILRVPGTMNYPDEKKRTQYHRVEGPVVVFDKSDQRFDPADFGDLRQLFPREARDEHPIDDEPAAALPGDWETRLAQNEWARLLWTGTAEIDGDRSPSGYAYHLALWLERNTPYTDAEKLAILVGHYPEGLGERRPKDELHRKARCTLSAARSHGGQNLNSASALNTKPNIQVNNRQFADIVADAWSAVLRANDPPSLFVRDDRLVRVKTVEDAGRIDDLSEDAMYGHLARTASWKKATRSGPTHALPPKQLAKDMLAIPHPNVPVLHGVIETPVFGQRGHLLATSGYHADDAVWVQCPSSLAGCSPPPHPTAAEIAAARALLLDDLLVDFQFAALSDRAHAVAGMLLPFVRPMIPGCTPMHLIEAASPGTGKGLLADAISVLSTGQNCAPTTVPRDDAEVRKKITAMLMMAPPVVLLDNVTHHLNSADLASALTADPWQDRLLGANRIIRLPNKATWLLTANNPTTTLEIARRSVRIRIEPGTDQPWLRTGFKHNPLRQWIHDSRGRLVHAVLVLVQAWVVAGRPVGNRVLGSFEAWSNVIGGILTVAGIPGFLENLENLYETADAEGRQWRALCSRWWEAHQGQKVNATEIYKLADAHQLLGSVLGDKGDRAAAIRLGKALHSHRGRHFGPWRLGIDNTDGSHTWYFLVQDSDAGSPPPRS
jgi:hypothetical protein